MARVKKYDKKNKDYYLSELDDMTLAKRALIIRILAIAAAAVYVPFVVLYIYPGYAAPTVVENDYTGLSMYIILTFALPAALIVCAVLAFFTYTPRRETLVRQSPPFGFRVIPYVGMLVSLVLAVGFAVYHTVLTAFTAGSVTDTAAAVLLWACAALVAGYYFTGFFTYRACVLIEMETDDEAEADRVLLPTFRLSDEEIEQGKSAFAPPKEKKKKQSPPTDGSADSDNGNDDNDK